MLAAASLLFIHPFGLAIARAQTAEEAHIRTVAELASRIANAKIAEERAALINSNKDLVTVELDKVLLAEGVRPGPAGRRAHQESAIRRQDI